MEKQCVRCLDWKEDTSENFGWHGMKRKSICRVCQHKSLSRKDKPTNQRINEQGKIERRCSFCLQWKDKENDFHARYATCKKCRKLLMPKKDPAIQKENNLRRLYGIGLAEFQSYYERQKGQCAICRLSFEGMNSKYVHIDHDHQTGEIRGLLCYRCNTILGRAEDNIEILTNAAAYLSAYRLKILSYS